MCAARVKASLLTFRWSLHVGQRRRIRARLEQGSSCEGACLLTRNAGVSEIARHVDLASLRSGASSRGSLCGEGASSSLLTFRWSLHVKRSTDSYTARAAEQLHRGMSLTLNAGVSAICACRWASIDRGWFRVKACGQRVRSSLLTFRWSHACWGATDSCATRGSRAACIWHVVNPECRRERDCEVSICIP